jgi:hypothetical protein
MRKELVADTAQQVDAPPEWLDLASHARVRLTSEDPTHAIECALQEASDRGWRAPAPGPQTIWIDFDVPQLIREIHVRFEIAESRTQEFVLLASTDDRRSYRELVRQQFNFYPETAAEDEHYFPQLDHVTGLKLTIIPDISGGDAHATLRALRVR